MFKMLFLSVFHIKYTKQNTLNNYGINNTV